MKINEEKSKLFEHVDTEEKAYWLGMLMADGSIAVSRNRSKVYGIKFGLCDLDVMEKFKTFLGIEKSTPFQILRQTNCQPVYYLYISSQKIAEDIGKYGMVPQKTHRTYIPELSQHLIRHFIRGYFDGDGCLHMRKAKRKDGTFRIEKNILITSCSTKILKQIEIILKRNNLIKNNKNYIRFPKEYKGKKHPPYLDISHRMAVHNFLEFIYKDAQIYMDRKYNLYLSIKNDILPQQRSKKYKYFGVRLVKRNVLRPYFASFIYNTIEYRLGYFSNEKDAALAYNQKIKELNLPDNMLNKID